eukprot:362638-Chlamydomonas_euryale.AAC.1
MRAFPGPTTARAAPDSAGRAPSPRQMRDFAARRSPARGSQRAAPPRWRAAPAAAPEAWVAWGRGVFGGRYHARIGNAATHTQQSMHMHPRAIEKGKPVICVAACFISHAGIHYCLAYQPSEDPLPHCLQAKLGSITALLTSQAKFHYHVACQPSWVPLLP